MMEKQQPLSLLWPVGMQPAQRGTALEAQCIRDLELDLMLSALTESGPGRSQICGILQHLCPDAAVIAYRQDILADVWHHPALAAGLETLLPHLSALGSYRSSADRRHSVLQDVTSRLGELEQFVTCVDGLHDVFTQLEERLQAPGWRTLRARIGQIARDHTYQNLRRELPDLLNIIRAKASVTIGVNLDSRLRPVAATLVSVNEAPFTASSFLDRILGRSGEDGQKGIGPLHTVPRVAATHGLAGYSANSQDINPLMVPLFHDLAQVLDAVCQPVARALRQYVDVQSGFLAALSGDVAFYLAATRLMTRLQQSGLPLCRPEIAPMAERVFTLRSGYNLNLALHALKPHAADADGGVEAIVTNDVDMDDTGRILILTGPNRGGKTTYTQMVGLCQILAQAGLWVPAQQARISPVDSIFTHYPLEESLRAATGRFGDEAQRLSRIFAAATRHSLILLNESLASTSPGESLYIAQDIVRILRRMSTRAIFGTHLHELAAGVDQLNASTAGDSRIVSLVASRLEAGEDGHRRSYKIVPGRPIGRSYAREIAAQYGISYDQLSARLRQRGVLD